MKLHVLAVHDAGARPIGRRQPIPRGTGWVGGVQVEVPQTTRSQEGAPGQRALYLPGGWIEQEGAVDADGVVHPHRVEAMVGTGDEVH